MGRILMGRAQSIAPLRAMNVGAGGDGDEKRLPWGSLGGYFLDFLDFLDFLVGLEIPSRARRASTVGSLPRNAL